MASRIPLCVLLLIAVASCGDDGDHGAGGRPNLVVISIDTLRADHLGCYGYAPYAEPVSPCIDAIARDALVCESCFTPRGQTGPSLASLLTGRYPSGHGVLDNFESLREDGLDLVDGFADAGYEPHAFLSWLPIKKSSKATLGFVENAARRGSWFEAKPQMQDDTQARWDAAAEHTFLEFVKERRNGSRSGARPFFAWLHFYDVHQPYSPPAAIHQAFAGDYHGPLRLYAEPTEAAFNGAVLAYLNAQMRARAPLDPADARYVTALYDGGIHATDARVGRLMDALREAGLEEQTIVVITADHGEELGEHNGFWFHGNSVHDSVLRIPLIVRGPGIHAGRFDGLVQNVDVLPTLLELAGARPPADVDGLSFAAVLRGAIPAAPIRAIAWGEWGSQILSARTPTWKLILNPRGAHPKKPPYDTEGDGGYFIDCRELYDVVHDRGETKNLWRERRGEVEELRSCVADEYARRFGELQRSAPDPVDAAERQKLRELGYLGEDAEQLGEVDFILDPALCDEE